MYNIKFNFEEKGRQSVEIKDAKEGLSVLEIALLNDINLHHNCGGVCACSTCHVYLLKGENSIDELTDKEEDFIDRAKNPRINSRLGCQCLLLNGSGNIEVTIPDQTVLLGEED
jgi:ferredoxin, 2Fe-2S